MAEALSDAGHRLPRGRHGLTRGAVVEHQRQRLIHAVPAAVREKGYRALTVEDITAGAGVSRRTFYENFRDKEDCFMTSYRHHAQELMATVVAAAAAGVDWEERGTFALAALLRFFAQRPNIAHMGVIEAMAAGPAALAERDQAIVALASLIGDEALASAGGEVPELLLRTTAGSILQLIYARVLVDQAEALEELLPLSRYMVLVAFQGPQAAATKAGLLPAGAPE
jgi:AcrR family transcriptional regulator